MKHIFIINPNSGKGKGYDIIMPRLKACLAKRDIENEIYVTKSAEDATEYARTKAAEGVKMRMYACGGDGTVYSIVNAIYGCDNVEFAVIPLGSGNDFIRLFGTKEQFSDLDAQIDGTSVRIDAIRCGDRIAVNQCSMGMDAEVCAKQSDFKNLPLLTGESAYTASLLYCLWTKRKNRFTVTIDDGEPFVEDLIFAFCGNSRFYGGGYQAGPYALPDDGLLDFCTVKTMSAPKLITKISDYKKGKHFVWPETRYLRGKKMNIKSELPAAVNVDGECDIVTESTFEILENAFSFVIPTTSSYIEDRHSGKVNNKIPTK